MQQVRGFVGHQKFGAIGSTQNKRSSGAETPDNNCVFCGHLALAQEAADLALEAGRCD
jgi:hypothetical protein